MGDAIRMSYDNTESARIYQEWYPHGLHHVLVNYANCQYFGDMTDKSVVEFGCGDGSFLRKCLNKGASSCLGYDINEAMVTAGTSAQNDEATGQHVNGSQSPGHIRLAIQDCFKPIDIAYDHYDLAVAQFLLHECHDEMALKNFITNVFQLLKPGGKLFIGQCPFVATTLKDQEVIADLCGYLHPTRDDSEGKDPFFARVPAFYPCFDAVSGTRRPFSRKQLFTFTDHYWSKEKLMKNLERSFTNVKLLPQLFPQEVPSFEAKQLQALEEPIILIGAEKPF